MTTAATRHVVLVTYGEPPTASFLDQLAYSWRILLGLTRKVDAIPRPMLPVIALARARGRRRLWQAHDYGSPLEPLTERQKQRMSDLLGSDDPSIRWRAHVAYEYRAPLLGDVVASLPPDEPVCVVPMYAAESAFTHALSREAVAGRRQAVRVLDALAADRLADISASHILSLTERDGWSSQDVALVLAAHGTVLEPPKPLDTGREATEALCAAIASRLSDRFGLIVNGWLNHTRGGRWTEPPIEEALAEVRAKGYSRVVYYPYGFLADNAESELEGRLALAGVPDLEARHLPCLNDSPILMELLARQIREAAIG
jgi:protoheme ferro-lyase